MTVLTQHTPRLSRARALELVARKALAGAQAGGHRSPFLGSSLDFAEHRDYQPGDDLRHLDWRAWARTDRLLLRRFHDERRLPLALVVDLSASMAYGQPTKQRQARIIAAALALLAADQGDEVRVLMGPRATWRPWSAGAAGGLAAVHALAHAECSGDADAAILAGGAAGLDRRSLVVVVSDLLGEVPPLARALALVAGAGHELAVIQVLDRSELELPLSWGRTVLEDPEGAIGSLTCDVRAAKAAYDQAISAHLREVRRACSGARADHVLVPTDQEPARTLASWLHARRRR